MPPPLPPRLPDTSDLGHADVGFNRASYNVSSTAEVQTPTLDGLVSNGVLLKRHYVHKMCTPTRTSVQSGRLPVHVSTSLANPEKPNCGIARNMTGMAAVLKRAGYATVICCMCAVSAVVVVVLCCVVRTL